MPLDIIREPSRFIEDFRVGSGRRQEIGRFFLQADRELTELGLRLFVSRDLRRLVEVNLRHRDSWAALMPAFDPAAIDVHAHGAFMFELRDARHEVVATQVSRLLDLSGTSLKAELESLRLFYRDPAKQAGPNERIEVTAPKAEEIAGRVALTGGLWYRPDWRGKGISALMPRMTRTFAHTSWDPDTVISFVEQSAIDHRIVQQYHLPDSEPWILIRDSYRPAVDLYLTWRHRADLVTDVGFYLADLSSRRERVREVPETQNSPELVRQGKRRRS